MPKTLSGFANKRVVTTDRVVTARRGATQLWAFLVAAAVGCLTIPIDAAIERLETQIEIAADGSYTEHRRLEVRLDDRSDVDNWRVYVVALDDHRRLLSADAWRINSSGRQKKLSRRERDEAEYAGEGITYSSQRFLLFEPEHLEIGTKLRFDIRLEVEPYFPAGLLALRPNEEAIESLEITVRSKAGALRASAPPGLELTTAADQRSMTLRGSMPAPDESPAYAAVEPSLLRFAWGQAGDWSDVARWYAELEGVVQHGGTAFDELSAQVNAAGESSAARLEAAVDIARRGIRYVAVEVGIGGYRPSPASETAERGWGDCKDKSLLLIELLRAAGLEAHPALIRLDRERRIHQELPTPYDFNHLIAAIEAEGLDLDESAPVADGLLFIDPTQTTGSASYLHRGVQDQDALVITGGESGGRLVRLPTLPHSEMVDVEIDVRPGEQRLAVDVSMRFMGETGSYLTRSLDASSPVELESLIRRQLLGFFPGAHVGQPTWGGSRDGLPIFEVRASLELDNPDLATLRLPAPDVFPSLADLDALEGYDAALSPTAARYRSRLHLPEGHCPPRERDDRIENAAGQFRHTVAMSDHVLEVSQEAVLARAWHNVEQLPELRELAVAEHRASRRRLRFQCRQ